MNANDYQKAALRTERTPDFVKPEPYENDRHPIAAHAEAQGRARLLHGMIGVCTEAGELQDMMKKALIYAKPFDRVNVLEECGDIAWYLALCLDAAGFTFEECLERNIDKLRKRFPDKFSFEAANVRDLDAERKVLEGAPQYDRPEGITDAEYTRRGRVSLIARLHDLAGDMRYVEPTSLAAKLMDEAGNELERLRDIQGVTAADLDHAIEITDMHAGEYGDLENALVILRGLRKQRLLFEHPSLYCNLCEAE